MCPQLGQGTTILTYNRIANIVVMHTSAHDGCTLRTIFDDQQLQGGARKYHRSYDTRARPHRERRINGRAILSVPWAAQTLGEFWWTQGKHRWVFFDDLETSETYAEQVERCPACGRPLERKSLSKAVAPAN